MCHITTNLAGAGREGAGRIVRFEGIVEVGVLGERADLCCVTMKSPHGGGYVFTE